MTGQPMRRALALLLAGVYALSLSGSLLHQILVEHVRCADHGDLVHAAPGDDHHGPWSVDPTTTAAVGISGSTAAEHLDAHAHEHCAVAAFATMAAATSAVVVVASPSPPPPVLAAQQQRSPPDAHTPWADRERFRLAPKGSPPV
jgi:hypothetical protein